MCYELRVDIVNSMGISWICFIPFLYLDVYVPGDDRSIS